MSGQNLYYDLVSILRDAGCAVGENSITAGWERRARSSGGFPEPPKAVWWHHTASEASVESDLTWQIRNCPDAPVGNVLLDRTGVFWPVAGGASNCAGKGGPASFSRGTVAKDSGNTGGFQIEVQAAGTPGHPWPEVQIDAYFRGSNALNAFVGNQPTDVITHRRWAPDRKIDPAVAADVQGPWRPRSETSSGTWNMDDIKAECAARAGTGPLPGPLPPPPGGDDDMVDGIYRNNGGINFLVWASGNKMWLQDEAMTNAAKAYCRIYGRPDKINDGGQDLAYFAVMGMVVGPVPPRCDEWGNFLG